MTNGIIQSEFNTVFKKKGLWDPQTSCKGKLSAFEAGLDKGTLWGSDIGILFIHPLFMVG